MKRIKLFLNKRKYKKSLRKTDECLSKVMDNMDLKEEDSVRLHKQKEKLVVLLNQRLATNQMD